jgi:hypothetical protein
MRWRLGFAGEAAVGAVVEMAVGAAVEMAVGAAVETVVGVRGGWALGTSRSMFPDGCWCPWGSMLVTMRFMLKVTIRYFAGYLSSQQLNELVDCSAQASTTCGLPPDTCGGHMPGNSQFMGASFTGFFFQAGAGRPPCQPPPQFPGGAATWALSCDGRSLVS